MARTRHFSFISPEELCKVNVGSKTLPPVCLPVPSDLQRTEIVGEEYFGENKEGEIRVTDNASNEGKISVRPNLFLLEQKDKPPAPENMAPLQTTLPCTRKKRSRRKRSELLLTTRKRRGMKWHGSGLPERVFKNQTDDPGTPSSEEPAVSPESLPAEEEGTSHSSEDKDNILFVINNKLLDSEGALWNIMSVTPVENNQEVHDVLETMSITSSVGTEDISDLSYDSEDGNFVVRPVSHKYNVNKSSESHSSNVTKEVPHTSGMNENKRKTKFYENKRKTSRNARYSRNGSKKPEKCENKRPIVRRRRKKSATSTPRVPEDFVSVNGIKIFPASTINDTKLLTSLFNRACPCVPMSRVNVKKFIKSTSSSDLSDVEGPGRSGFLMSPPLCNLSPAVDRLAPLTSQKRHENCSDSALECTSTLSDVSSVHTTPVAEVVDGIEERLNAIHGSSPFASSSPLDFHSESETNPVPTSVIDSLTIIHEGCATLISPEPPNVTLLPYDNHDNPSSVESGYPTSPLKENGLSSQKNNSSFSSTSAVSIIFGEEPDLPMPPGISNSTDITQDKSLLKPVAQSPMNSPVKSTSKNGYVERDLPHESVNHVCKDSSSLVTLNLSSQSNFETIDGSKLDISTAEKDTLLTEVSSHITSPNNSGPCQGNFSLHEVSLSKSSEKVGVNEQKSSKNNEMTASIAESSNSSEICSENVLSKNDQEINHQIFQTSREGEASLLCPIRVSIELPIFPNVESLKGTRLNDLNLLNVVHNNMSVPLDSFSVKNRLGNESKSNSCLDSNKSSQLNSNIEITACDNNNILMVTAAESKTHLSKNASDHVEKTNESASGTLYMDKHHNSEKNNHISISNHHNSDDGSQRIEKADDKSHISNGNHSNSVKKKRKRKPRRYYPSPRRVKKAKSYNEKNHVSPKSGTSSELKQNSASSNFFSIEFDSLTLPVTSPCPSDSSEILEMPQENRPENCKILCSIPLGIINEKTKLDCGKNVISEENMTTHNSEGDGGNKDGENEVKCVIYTYEPKVSSQGSPILILSPEPVIDQPSTSRAQMSSGVSQEMSLMSGPSTSKEPAPFATETPKNGDNDLKDKADIKKKKEPLILDVDDILSKMQVAGSDPVDLGNVFEVIDQIEKFIQSSAL